MNNSKIVENVITIFSDVLKVDKGTITTESTTKDIKRWDSLNNMLIITKIEKHYSIKFKLTDVLKFNNVGAICDAVKSSLK